MFADIETIDYYERNASAFIGGTAKANMSVILSGFLACIPQGGHILDWGCGSGRDAAVMFTEGYKVTAVDASHAMCENTRKLVDCDVRNETFSQLCVNEAYDGIWACASLLHLHKEELPDAFARAHSALKPGAVMYCSFKYGDFAGMSDGRWFTYLNEESLERILEGIFSCMKMYVTADVRPGRGNEKWLNCLAFKASKD
ncbi:MAG: class I SAM-dependent methyltransferase [Coriobacteriaceae bacterium]|nr:class I SAM-dependent methyltransferase [Coriobacteriaceae bacterium]